MSAPRAFTKDFTLQEPIPDEGIAAALEVMRSGRLHRYNSLPGETSETALLEKEFAEYMGSRFCLALSSCGSALYIGMKSLGVAPGDKVLCNAYTLAPVPGAIQNAGAQIVLVEIADDYTVNLADLEAKAKAPDVKWFLLSHMRGHIADMDAVMDICNRHGVTVIEDCAHTMGARWNGKKSGSFGAVGCFSTQTYKHMNSGEGGLLVTDDEEVMARAVIYSGSYMLYEKHIAAPDPTVFNSIKYETPNYSSRMDNLRAAILRPQLRALDRQCERWNERFRLLEDRLNKIEGIACPVRSAKEQYVGSSIQFDLVGASVQNVRAFLVECEKRGVSIKWFGNEEPVGFTSAYSSWRYFKELPTLPDTNRILAVMCDMRIPLTFTLEDCIQISDIIKEVATETLGVT